MNTDKNLFWVPGFSPTDYGKPRTVYTQPPPGYMAPQTVYGPPSYSKHPHHLHPQLQLMHGPPLANPGRKSISRHVGDVSVARPSDHLLLSLVSCFCFFPMAIAAVVFSLRSRSAADAGDIDLARSRGSTALQIAVAAIITGILALLIGLAVNISNLL